MLNLDAVEIAVVDTKEKFRVLPRDKSKNYVKKAMEKKIYGRRNNRRKKNR